MTKATHVREALAACLLVTDKSRTLPILAAVKVSKEGKTLTLTATDRYQLVRAEIDLGVQSDTDWSLLIDQADVKRFIAALPKTSSRYGQEPMAVLSFSDAAFGVEAEGSTIVATPVEGEYPKVASIITEDKEATEQIGFNPGFMVNLCKMPREKNTPVQMVFNGRQKPMRADWDFNDVKYVYILMPVRVR
jgi:DNA polymerase III sliding clamp (beta) subunit (PCNA family)